MPYRFSKRLLRKPEEYSLFLGPNGALQFNMSSCCSLSKINNRLVRREVCLVIFSTMD